MYKSHELGDHSDVFTQEGTIIEKTVKVFSPKTIYIGRETYIGHDAKLYGYPYNSSKSIIIGDRCWIGYNVILSGAGGIIIGNRVGIGPGVQIYSSEHDLGQGYPLIMDNPLTFKPVLIEDGVDIGAGSLIRSGVHIGKWAQIGIGSVVIENVRENAIYAGNPAKFIRFRENREPSLMESRI